MSFKRQFQYNDSPTPFNKRDGSIFTPADFETWIRTMLEILAGDQLEVKCIFKQSLTHKYGWAIDWSLSSYDPSVTKQSPLLYLNSEFLKMFISLTAYGLPCDDCEIGVLHLLEHDHVHSMVIVNPKLVYLKIQELSDNMVLYEGGPSKITNYTSVAVPKKEADAIRRRRIAGFDFKL